MAKDAHAPIKRSPLDLEHLILLKPRQARMPHVERDRCPGNVVGREPVIRKPKVWPKLEAAVFQLCIELFDSLFQLGPLDPDIEITYSQVKELLIGPIHPFGFRKTARARHS